MIIFIICYRSLFVIFAHGDLSKPTEEPQTLLSSTKLTCERAGEIISLCSNYVTSVSQKNISHIELCGTNALSPELTTFRINDENKMVEVDKMDQADQICTKKKSISSNTIYDNDVRYTSIGGSEPIISMNLPSEGSAKS
jgi:hypothetical protein